MKPPGQLRRAPATIRRRGELLAPRRRPADTGPDRDTTAAVYARDGHCLLAGYPVPSPAAPGGAVVLPCVRDLSRQHRCPRQAGGTTEEWINDPANLGVLCGDGTRGHHAWVEDHRTAAERLGLLVRRHEDGRATFAAVLRTPVYRRGEWVLLTQGGTFLPLVAWDPHRFPDVDAVAELAARVLADDRG